MPSSFVLASLEWRIALRDYGTLHARCESDAYKPENFNGITFRDYVPSLSVSMIRRNGPTENPPVLLRASCWPVWNRG